MLSHHRSSRRSRPSDMPQGDTTTLAKLWRDLVVVVVVAVVAEEEVVVPSWLWWDLRLPPPQSTLLAGLEPAP